MNNTPWDVLAASITRLKDKVDAYPSVREATLHGVAPLSVMFDTDTQPTSVHGSLASDPVVGDRVLTLKLSHYVWILGIKGGQAPSLPIQPASQAEANAGSISDKYISPKTLRDRGYAPWAMAAGAIVTSTGGAVAVTLPAGRFTQQPRVVAEVVDHPNVCVTHTRAVSATSFSLSAYTIGGGIVAAPCHWQAVQMTSSNGSG